MGHLLFSHLNSVKFTLTIFRKNSVKAKQLVLNHSALHIVVKRKNYSKKNNSSNHLFSNFFSKNVSFTNFLPKTCGTKSQQFPTKNVVFTKFLPKMRESKFPKLPHHDVEITEFYCHDFAAKISSN